MVELMEKVYVSGISEDEKLAEGERPGEEQGPAESGGPAEAERLPDEDRLSGEEGLAAEEELRGEEEPIIKEESSPIWLLLPLFVFAGLIITVVRLHKYQRPMSRFFWTSLTDESWISDFFSYYKMILIIVCAGLGLIALLVAFSSVKDFRIKKSYAYIPIGVYSAGVIVSFIFSEYKDFSWLGWNERFEGTLPILCYMFMLFYAINVIRGKKDVQKLLGVVGISSGVLGILGISQSIGKDFFRTAMGQKFVSPNILMNDGERLWDVIDRLAESGETFFQFLFGGNQIYQTVYNPNYVSFYTAMLIPIFGMLFIYRYNKIFGILHMEKKAGEDEDDAESREWVPEAATVKDAVLLSVLAVLFGLLVYNLMGASSTGGIVGLLSAVFVGMTVLRKRIFEWLKPLVVLLLISALSFMLAVDFWVPSAYRLYRNFFPTEDTYEEDDVETIKPHIDYFHTGIDDVSVSLNGNRIKIEVCKEDGKVPPFRALDESGASLNLIPFESHADTYGITDERFRDYLIISHWEEEGENYIILNMPGRSWTFRRGEDRMYFVNELGKETVLAPVEAFGFENNLNFGSGRGYIWSRTLPLLKNTVLWGYGADTFTEAFPQNDYAEKYNIGKGFYNINDKPHSIYLGFAVNTGCVSLLALSVLFACYLLESLKLYSRADFYSDFDYLIFVGAGLSSGIVAFLVGGLVNDTTVSVMPLFYSLLGAGIAVNSMIKSRFESGRI